MKITKCRNCKNSKLLKLFSLGSISFTGKFVKNKKLNITKAPLDLVMCKKCKLVQLRHSYNLKYLYGPDYGYRTGINQTMTQHVRKITETLVKKTKISYGEYVLDIASNDATLLKFYNKKYFTFGIDPLVNKYRKEYNNINFKVSSFFSKNKIVKKTKKKFKIITALSVFYDLDNPNKFLKDVESLLEDDGMLLIEFADILSMLRFNMFDAICHEHLTYYTFTVFEKILSILAD